LSSIRCPFVRAARGAVLAVLALPVAHHARAQDCCGEPRPAHEAVGPAVGLQARWPTVLTDARRGVVIAWAQHGGAWLAISLDDGETWAPRRSFGGPGVSKLDVANTPDGHLLVAWTDAGATWSSMSADQGRTFSAPRVVGDGAMEDQHLGPALDLAADGRALLAWSDATSLWVSCSDDFGATWTARRAVNGVPLGWVVTDPWGGQSFSGAFEPILAGPDAVVAFTLREGASSTLWFARSVGSCGTWLAPIAGSADPIDPIYGIGLVTTGAPRMVAAWHRAGHSLRVRPSLDGGASWEPEIDLGPIGASSFRLTVKAAADGRVALACEGDVGRSLLHVSTQHGLAGSWLAAWSIATGCTWASNHDIGLREGAPLIVAWDGVCHRDPCDYYDCRDIYLDQSCDDGATWLAACMRLDSDAAPWHPWSHSPALAIGPNGRIHVAWLELEQGGWDPPQDMHYRSLDPARVDVEGDLVGTLRVTRAGASLIASWTDAGPASGYNLYAGSVASLSDRSAYDHAPLACHVPRQAGLVAGSVTLPLPSGDAYLLVAVASCSQEGSVGDDSFGVPRPLSPTAPPCGPLP